MKNKIATLVTLTAILMITGTAQSASFTVATFADPSTGASDPLFNVLWPGQNAGTVNAGWADGKGGLTLEIPFVNLSFSNAWFEMDELAITGTTSMWGQMFGQTGAGQIRFYGEGSSCDPLLVLDFDTAMVSQFAVGSNDFFANVSITGSVIPCTLSDEVFSFGFANVTPLNGDTNIMGFNATTAFTSSAIPEPATIILLSIGALAFMKKK